MGLKVGTIIPMNLVCGCCKVYVTLLKGKQTIQCPQCGRVSVVVIETNWKDIVTRFKVRWSYID